MIIRRIKRLIDRLKWHMSEEYIQESRHAHRAILLSSCGGAKIAGKDGKMVIGHIKVSEEEVMKEGFFISRSGKAIKIREHEQDLRANYALLKSLGVKQATVKVLCEENEDREELLTEILKLGVLRFRGHGAYATAEFWGDEMSAIRGLVKFGEDYLCADSTIRLVDIKTMTGRWVTCGVLSNETKEDS